MGLVKFFVRNFVWLGCLFGVSTFVSAGSLYTRVGYTYYLPIKEDGDKTFTGDAKALKSCLSDLPSVSGDGNPDFFTDGSVPAKIDDVVTDVGGMYTAINYGERKESRTFGDGQWKYAIAFKNGATASVIAQKAVRSGNCELIKMLLTVKPTKEGDLDVYENPGSYKCAFASDGSGACHYNTYDKLNPQDGSPLIDVCTSEYCYQTRDPYKDLRDRNSESSQDSSGNSNNSGKVDEIRGPDSIGGSGTGSGSSSGSSSGTGSGSSSGTGSGSSSGTGSGTDDDEGTEEDGENLAKGFEFGKIDFEWSSLFSTIHKAVQGSVPDFDLSISGQCQSLDLNLNFGYFSVNERLTLHCQLFDSIKDLISGFFLMFWSFSAVRRILSA